MRSFRSRKNGVDSFSVCLCVGLSLVYPSLKPPVDFPCRTYRQVTLGQDAVVCKDAELTGEITLGTYGLCAGVC